MKSSRDPIRPPLACEIDDAETDHVGDWAAMLLAVVALTVASPIILAAWCLCDGARAIGRRLCPPRAAAPPTLAQVLGARSIDELTDDELAALIRAHGATIGAGKTDTRPC